jgi:similar to stage IV sporulation protein
MRYEPVPSSLTKSEAEAILKSGLTARLRGEIGDGEILASDFETDEKNGVVTVTLRAECREQIARERDFTDSEQINNFDRNG